MKTKAISSIFVLFAIAAGMASMAPDAFADHAEVAIVTVDESGFSQTCAEAQGGSGCYVPVTATVDVGGVVTMTNTDPTGVHTFTSGTVDGFAPSPDGVFDTGVLMSGDAFEWVPEAAGEQPYYCMLHTWMIGTIIVQEAAAEEHVDDHAEAAAEAAAEEAEHAAMEHAEAEDVELMVMISDAQVMGGTQIELEFNVLHLNYDLTATQNGEVVFEEKGLHSMELIATHQIDALGSDENPIDVEVVSLGIGAPGDEDSWTGPVGQVTTAKVVPEFGTIAMMVLAVAIISIVAVTAKSRVVPIF
jgi:predicted secreted protein with PEFG-CTERM motif